MARKRTDETIGKLLENGAELCRAARGKSAVWSCVVYPAGDDIDSCKKSYETFIERMHAAGGDNYTFALHDKDKDENGDLKKPHIHIVKRFNKSVSVKYCAEWLGRSIGDCITETSLNAFRVVEDAEAADKYPQHPDIPVGEYGDNGKYGYGADAVVRVGRVVPVGYADFMELVFTSEGFLDLCSKCRGNEELSKMLMKHGYFAKAFYSTAKNGE